MSSLSIKLAVKYTQLREVAKSMRELLRRARSESEFSRFRKGVKGLR